MLAFEHLAVGAGFLERERERVQAHFAWVVEVLRVQRTGHLSTEALAARERALATLEAYARRGIFPRNPLGDRMVPTFVDAGGRECAVAHLMLATGDDELVESMRRSKNLEHVAAMVGPALGTWSEAAGLSLEEVAFIQPDYCPGQDTPCSYQVPDGCMPPLQSCPCTTVRRPDGTPCTELGDFCDLRECRSGQCVPTGEVRTCDDGLPETVDTCDAERGCISVELVLPLGELGEGDTESDGCAYRASVPDGSWAALLAGLFLLGVRRRTSARS